MTRKTLLLVDGSSYLFRAFHALPDLRNKDDEPTGAIHGIVGMLRRLRDDTRLHDGALYGAVVFDAPGRTFRDDLYADYKATRTEMPDDLRRQIEPIHEMAVALGWPLLVIPGIEADDVIGTLARRAAREGMRTVISTSDKDLAQLVDDDTILVNTMTRDGSPAEPLDARGVVERFGVPPERIVDYLSLTGDPVDNVPGVDKVGPKTAAKWIGQYGSLEGVMAHAAEVGGKVGENLRAALDWLPKARELVTVKVDCDLSRWLGSLEDLALRPENTGELLRLFGRWELRTLARRLEESTRAEVPGGSGGNPGAVSPPSRQASTGTGNPASADGPGSAAAPAGAAPADAGKAADEPPRHYETVLDLAGFDRWLGRIDAAELTAIATVTTSVEPMTARLVGLSLSVAPYAGCYIPLAHRYTGAPDQLPIEMVLARLRPWLESPAKRKVGRNLKYDMHVLANHGLGLAGIEHDTLLEAYVLEAHRNNAMDALAARHLERRVLTYPDVVGKGAKSIGFDQVEVGRATEYAAEVADVTLHLHQALYARIEAEPGLQRIYRDIEMPTTAALQAMERHGVLIDARLLERQSEELGARLVALERQAWEAAGQPFNLGSPKQLCEVLFVKLQLPVLKKTASGSPSTDEEVLEKLAEDFPLPKLVLEWRGLAKLKSTYTDKLPRSVHPGTGRVHTTYSQAVAVTGRLASTEPNLQNIPIRTPEGRRIREAFIAPPGHRLMSADYSQIELRIMAHISQDEGLLGAFSQGLDVHRATAAEVFGTPLEQVTSEQRRYAKVINFGLIYGMSAFGLAANLGIERDAARNYIERYFARYPGVAAYMERTRTQARQQGYVETVFGRRLWLAEINSPNGPRRAAAERAAINAPMQGTAADLIKMAMVDVWRWIGSEKLGARLVMQVHDELVLEVPESEIALLSTELPRRMSSVATLSVPLLAEVGVGSNWDEAH
ncbi:MAG: DNA polymerase I [Burkholderiaceae bacterium]|nr:DNA polymerase I [Burkholderiaceae bacterium]